MAEGFEFRIDGLDEVLRRLEQAVADRRRQVHAGLVEEGEALMETAKERVPVNTGELRDSGHVVVSDELEVALVFDAPHAFVVHEDLTAQHPDGEAKFLERTVLEASSGLPEAIGRRVK